MTCASVNRLLFIAPPIRPEDCHSRRYSFRGAGHGQLVVLDQACTKDGSGLAGGLTYLGVVGT